MAVVYAHRRLDNNQIFYIGIGTRKDRPYSKQGRNRWWRNTVAKVNYQVEILLDNITIGRARQIERGLISMYGRKDLGRGNLVNLTDGGEGSQGMSNKGREKLALLRRTTKITDETREKHRLNMLGNTFASKPMSKEHKEVRSKNSSNSKAVDQYKDGLFIQSFPSAAKAGKILNIDPSTIRKVVKGLKITAGGYMWKYSIPAKR